MDKIQALNKVRPGEEALRSLEHGPEEGKDLEADEGRPSFNIRRLGRRRGKNKKHMHRKGETAIAEVEVMDNKFCKLCNRENPLYFYQ